MYVCTSSVLCSDCLCEYTNFITMSNSHKFLRCDVCHPFVYHTHLHSCLQHGDVEKRCNCIKRSHHIQHSETSEATSSSSIFFFMHYHVVLSIDITFIIIIIIIFIMYTHTHTIVVMSFITILQKNRTACTRTYCATTPPHTHTYNNNTTSVRLLLHAQLQHYISSPLLGGPLSPPISILPSMCGH